ncbi:MAG: hypothetical protein IJ224_12315 [Lachnospiraceae bacterium]|nr:hypothetical protein [Lachnospiraceae bacterium]
MFLTSHHPCPRAFTLKFNDLEKYYKYINIGNEMKEAIESMRMQAGAQSQANPYNQTGFNSQDAALIQATENMRRVEELKAIAATGTPEQLQAYLNNQQMQPQQQGFQPQMNGMQPGQQMQMNGMQSQPQSYQQQQFQSQQQMQSAPQMSVASATCPYCGSTMTPTPDGHCSVCSAPLN